MVVSDPHRLDLGSKRAAPSEPGQEAQLHGGQDLRAVGCDEQQVRWVGVDGVERMQVGLQVLVGGDAVAGCAELVGGQQAHDRGDILRSCSSQRHRLALHGQLRQHRHLTRLPHRCR